MLLDFVNAPRSGMQQNHSAKEQRKDRDRRRPEDADSTLLGRIVDQLHA